MHKNAIKDGIIGFRGVFLRRRRRKKFDSFSIRYNGICFGLTGGIGGDSVRQYDIAMRKVWQIVRKFLSKRSVSNNFENQNNHKIVGKFGHENRFVSS